MEPRAEIVDLGSATVSQQQVINDLLGYGLLGLLGLVCLYALYKFFSWVLQKLSDKDAELKAVRDAHEKQLEEMYTAHKAEVASMNKAFIDELRETQKGLTELITNGNRLTENNNQALAKIEDTLSKSLEKMGARIEALEDGQVMVQREVSNLKNVLKPG